MHQLIHLKTCTPVTHLVNGKDVNQPAKYNMVFIWYMLYDMIWCVLIYAVESIFFCIMFLWCLCWNNVCTWCLLCLYMPADSITGCKWQITERRKFSFIRKLPFHKLINPKIAENMVYSILKLYLLNILLLFCFTNEQKFENVHFPYGPYMKLKF